MYRERTNNAPGSELPFYPKESSAVVNSYLLKAPDAAAYLGMSLSWLKQKGKSIPYVRIGIKNKRWRIQDLDAFIAKNIRNAQ
ncbi:MAG: helix-turn-helix domain-containing protein [Candidatus Obscuribacterales bacterium]|nr:helix-turn-helix domain-containing protein [Candidatus Obscuribacterales bacterium]